MNQYQYTREEKLFMTANLIVSEGHGLGWREQWTLRQAAKALRQLAENKPVSRLECAKLSTKLLRIDQANPDAGVMGWFRGAARLLENEAKQALSA
jgi:hypothetical protein